MGRKRITAVNGLHFCALTPMLKSDRVDRLAGKATITNGLRLERSEVLKRMRHYLWAQSQGHHYLLEERGMERGSARRSSLKGWERATINPTNIVTISKAMLRKLLRDGVECTWAFASATIPSWTVLNKIHHIMYNLQWKWHFQHTHVTVCVLWHHWAHLVLS